MNKHLTRLRDKQKELKGQISSLIEAAEKEDRDFSEDEQTAYDEANSELASVEKRIERLEESLRREREQAGRAGQNDTDDFPGDPAQAGSNVGNPRPGFIEDPKKGFKSPREFLLCVMETSRRGGNVEDERLQYLAAAGSDEQGAYSDSYGGFLLPAGFSPDLLMLQPEDDPIGSRTTPIPMDTLSLEIPARVDKNHSSSVSGGLTVTRVAETQTGSSSRMQFENVKLEASELFGLAYATEKLLSFSPISFVALLEAGFQQQFKSHLINERINGTGVGEYLGVMECPALISVAKESGQAADTIVGLNVIKMRSRCWNYGQSVWIANHDCYPQLIQLHIESPNNAGVILLYKQSMQEDRPDMLLGRPIIYTEYAKTVGDKGDLLLGVWSEFLESTLRPLKSDESIHVRFLQNERTFRFVILNAGQPWWKSPLTPKNSSNTLSPFVTLDARA